MTEESLLTRCKQLSESISEYFDGMRYLGELDSAEEATPVFLTRLAVSMIMDELADIGITSNFEIDDFVTDHANFEAMFAMREKFDRITLYEYFKSMSDEQYATLCDILDATADDGDVFLELIHYICEGVSPLDMKFGQILQCSSQWTSTVKFRQHLDALRRKMDNTDTSKAVVNDSNIEAVMQLLNKIKSNQTTVLKCVKIVLSHYKDLNEDILRHEANTYDSDKTSPKVLHIFATHDKEEYKEFKSYKKHRLETKHHIDHWIYYKQQNKPTVFTKENGVMIVIALILDKLSRDQIDNELKKLFKIIPDKMLLFMSEVLDKLYNVLIGVVNEAVT